MLVSQTVVYFYSPLLQIFCLIEEFQMRKDIFIENQKRVDFTLKMNIWHLVKNIISPFSRCQEMSCFRFGRERFISLSFKAKSVGNMSNPSCQDHVPEILQWGTPVLGVHAGTCPICLEKGRHLPIQCLRCRQMPGWCQCLRTLRRTEAQNCCCPLCRFGPPGERLGESGSSTALNNSWPDEPSKSRQPCRSTN